MIIWLRILEAFDTPIGHRQKDEFVMLQPYEQAGEAMLNGERRAFGALTDLERITREARAACEYPARAKSFFAELHGREAM